MREEESDEEMASPAKERVGEVDNSDSESEDEQQQPEEDYSSKIRRALFAAVEGGQQDGDDDDGDSSLLSHRPLVRLFEPSNISRTLKAGANSKELKELLLHSVKDFHKGFARRFFSGIKPILQHVIQQEIYIPESAFEEDEERSQGTDRSTNPEEITPDPASSEALHFLLYSTQCLQVYVDSVVQKHPSSRKSQVPQQPIPIIADVCEVAEILHDLLFELHGCGPDGIPVQTAILNLCESWWHAQVAQRDPLVPMALTLMALKALGSEDRPPQKSDIKRLLKMRDAFQVIEWEDESSQSLRSLLQKLVSHPLCLKSKEGKKFLSGLFLVDPLLVQDLHSAIRTQIPTAKKDILQVFGEIYKRAWKDSQDHKVSEDIQQSIEHYVLQELMYAVLHAENPRMTKALLVVLEPFHEAKKVVEMESLLYRMYGPILWRALSAANELVRINAATVLGEVFPLSDSPTRADAALHRGAEKLLALLQDKCPKVRVAGSETVAKVLVNYWDVLATDDIRSLLNQIVAKHSSDKTSYQVRVAALNAATSLLDAPQAHAVLRALLPNLGNLIHDTNKHVRLAAVKMLLKIKSTKGIKYYHVVPVDHLKARLAEEGQINMKMVTDAKELFPLQSDVASGLTRLMLNSYVPQGPDVSAVDQIKRTLSFLATDPEAAAVFYANLADHLHTTAVAKLTAMLLRCLTSAVETEKKTKNAKPKHQRHDQDSDDSESEEDDEDESTFLTASNSRLMSSLSQAIASMWESIRDDLEYEENASGLKFLSDSFSGTVLTDMLSYFEQKRLEHANDDNVAVDTAQEDYHRVCAALLRCAGFLDPTDVKGLVTYISSSLRAQSTQVGDQVDVSQMTQNVSGHMALLCLWGMTEDVGTSLASSLSSTFDDVHHGEALNLMSPVSDDKSKKRKSGRGSSQKKPSAATKGTVLPQLPPEVALSVLDDILRGSDPSNVAARECLLETTKARETLEGVLELGIMYAGRLLRMASDRTQTMTDDHVDIVIRVCELFGRFELHKAAFDSLETGSTIQFSQQAKQLLEWTTEQVLPTLMSESNGFPLQELDLSRISFVNDSMVSMEADVNLDVMGTPGMMSPLAPPRKRGNRNATPERLPDGSFVVSEKSKHSKRKDSKIIPGDSTILLLGTASVSLLQSACIIFSEWLAVGDGCGSAAILGAAMKWCSMFDAKNDDDAKENLSSNRGCRKRIQRGLLPAFARLACTLGKTSEQFDLAQQLLWSCYQIGDEADENENDHIEEVSSVLGRMVSNLLKSPKIADKAVNMVLEVAYKTITNEEPGQEDDKNACDDDVDMSPELPDSMHSVLCGNVEDYGMGPSALAEALSVILNHKQGCVYLAKKLVENLDFHTRLYKGDEAASKTAEDRILQFEAKCLYVLASNAKNRPAVRDALKKLTDVDVKADSIKTIIQELVEGKA